MAGKETATVVVKTYNQPHFFMNGSTSFLNDTQGKWLDGFVRCWYGKLGTDCETLHSQLGPLQFINQSATALMMLVNVFILIGLYVFFGISFRSIDDYCTHTCVLLFGFS